MLLRETTDLGFARTFKRFSQGVVIGFALAGLAACGGGGSSTPASTPTPQMTITPRVVPVDDAVPQDAPVIVAGQTVIGSIDSPDDVEYYQLEIDKTSTIELTLDAEGPGLEVALLDSEGVVLQTAETSSQARLASRLLPQKLFARVRNLLENYDFSNTRAFTLGSGIKEAVEGVIDLITGIGPVTLPLGTEKRIDLSEHFRGETIWWGDPHTDRSEVLELDIDKNTLRIGASTTGPLRKDKHGRVRVTVSAAPSYQQITAGERLTTQVIKVDVVNGPPKPIRPNGVVTTIAAGGEWMSEPLYTYFYDEEPGLLTISEPVRGNTFGTSWTERLVGANTKSLVVSADESAAPNDRIVFTVTATDIHGLEGTAGFVVIIEGEEEEPTPMTPEPSPGDPEPTPMTPVACAIMASSNTACTEYIEIAVSCEDILRISGAGSRIVGQCPKALNGYALERSEHYALTSCRFTVAGQIDVSYTTRWWSGRSGGFASLRSICGGPFSVVDCGSEVDDPDQECP